MKEHEDEVSPSVDSAAVDRTVTERDLGEDMVVDVVGCDVVDDDQDMEDVAGLRQDGDGLVGKIRVLTSEKTEVVVCEEEAAVEGQDCDASVETRVLTSEKVEVMVNEAEFDRSGFNGDISVVDSKEATEVGLTEEVMKQHVVSVEDLADGKIAADPGSQEVDEGSVDPGLVCANDQSSAAVVVISRTDEVDESNKEDSLTDGAQEMTDGGRVANEKENEVLISSKISEPLVKTNPGSEDVDVDVVVVEQGLASKDDVLVDASLGGHDSPTGEGAINVHAANLDQQAEVDKLSEKDQTIEVITETAVMVNKEAAAGSTKSEEIMKQPAEPVQEVAYENGVMDDKAGKEDETGDSSKIPESLNAVDVSLGEVNGATPIADAVEHPVISREDAEIDREEDAGMDIDEVLGWKDEVPGIDVTSGAEKDEHMNVIVNSEASVEQKVVGSSSEPVLIQRPEEYVKPREPIVYGRRVHVEVPLLDVEQKLPEPSSPVSEDENLKIETDSEEEDDADDGSVQEDEQNVDRQNPELLENGNLVSLDQSSYFKPPENEGEFSISDLVWGKVRSHPWWPGQIIDPSNASKKAMKYFKKDCFLVAYFGDHSFAWNSSSVLKPFRANFSELEKQTDTEIFKTAVNCALEEASRRVELGLACSCVPKEIYKKIEYQVTENAGVRKKSDKIYGKDESASVSSFEPDKLVDYVRLLAQFPGQGNKMDLTITKAQLSAYGHYKGYRELPEFWVSGDGDMLEDTPVHETVEQVHINDEKIENNLIESVNPNKEVSLSEITDDAPESVGGNRKLVSSSGLKKRKARVSISNGSVKRPTRPSNKVSTAPVSTPKPSFKIGQVIQKVASQLSGPVVKSNGDPKVDQTVQTPENSQMEASVADMLSQLHLTAQDPMKEHSFFQTIIPFFYERRAAVFTKSLKKPSTVEKPDNETKIKPPTENEPEEFDFDFDFDDVNDSYWTDRIIQNQSEDQPLQDDQNGAVEEHPVVEYEPEKPAKRRRQSNKKTDKKQKRERKSNREPEPEQEPEPEVEEESELARKRRENLATEVILKFEAGTNFCSEIQLNKMFRRFGPLLESETEVDREGGRARVVFKKCFDAEVAHNSAGRFNIFGSVNVSYELNYSPLVSYRPLPLPLIQEDQMDAS